MLIGARTSIGKTSMAIQLAWDLAVNKKKVMFYSLEMHVPALLERLFCNIEAINNEELLHGNFEKKYTEAWVRFKKVIDEHYLILNDSIGKTWEEIDLFLSGLRDIPDVIFIDHVNHARTNKKTDDKRTIDDYVRHFRELAIRHNFSGILCAQVNRLAQTDGKDREPELHHLKGSGNLEEEADSILLLHWPWKYNNTQPVNKYKMIVAKNRNGRTGYIDLKYEPEYYRFSDWIQTSPLPDSPKKEKKITEPQQAVWDD